MYILWVWTDVVHHDTPPALKHILKSYLNSQWKNLYLGGDGSWGGMCKDTKKPGPLVFQKRWSLNVNCINGETEVKLKSFGSLGEIKRSAGSGAWGWHWE